MMTEHYIVSLADDVVVVASSRGSIDGVRASLGLASIAEIAMKQAWYVYCNLFVVLCGNVKNNQFDIHLQCIP